MKKQCTVCKKRKSLSEFNRHPQPKDGRGSQCKQCDIEQSIRRVQKKKRHLIELHGGKCLRCGYNKCPASLVFHHPNNDKESNVTNLMKCAFQKAVAESKKCELICANCHGEEHYKDRGPLLGRRRVFADHGSSGMYRKCGPPKCDACKEWKNAYMRQRWRRKKLSL